MDASEQLRIAAKRARERKDMRQEDVAEKLQQIGVNITSNAYAKFEGGTRGGKFDEVAAIAQVLELDLTAITRSVKTDVVGWVQQNAENRFKAAESALGLAKFRFESSAETLGAVTDLKKALAGETVVISTTMSAFVNMTLIDAASEIPEDLVEFFESLGDDGTVRAAVEGFHPEQDEPRWEGNKISYGHGRTELIQALSKAIARAVPNLSEPSYA